MSVHYSCYISDPFGTRLGDASDFVSLKYSRVVNNISTAYLMLPESFDQNLLRLPDGRLEIWRRLESGREYLDTETTWLIKAVEYARDDTGKRTLMVEADTPLCVFDQRIAYSFGSLYTSEGMGTALADNLIRTVVAYAIGDTVTNSAFTARRLTSYITLTSSQSLGPSVTKSYQWRNVLKVIQEIADTSAQNGVYLAFDITAPTPDTLMFQVYAGQRGVDHRFPGGANPVLLSPDMGNLAETTLRKDYRDEVTYAFCGGKGEGSVRAVANRGDETRIGASPFGHRETFIELTNMADLTTLRAEADAEVRAGRPRLTFRGKIVSTPGCQYGVHWSWGDYVTAQDFGQSFDCRIDAVTVTVENGQETVEAWLRAETAV